MDKNLFILALTTELPRKQFSGLYKLLNPLLSLTGIIPKSNVSLSFFLCHSFDRKQAFVIEFRSKF